MKIFAWLRSAALSLCAAFISLTAACSEERGDPSQFFGIWTFAPGSVRATCVGMTASEDLTDVAVTITAAADADLQMTTGTCVLKLDMQGAGASVRPGQSCELVVIGAVVRGQPTRWTLKAQSVADEIELISSGEGTGEIMSSFSEVPLPCERFEIDGRLVKRAPAP